MDPYCRNNYRLWTIAVITEDYRPTENKKRRHIIIIGYSAYSNNSAKQSSSTITTNNYYNSFDMQKKLQWTVDHTIHLNHDRKTQKRGTW